MKRLLLPLVVAACALCAGRESQAAFIFQDFTVPSTSTDWGPLPSPLPDIAQFDPSLGTLTKVVITLDGSMSGALELLNSSASSKTVTSTFGADIALSGIGGVLLTVSPTIGPFVDTIAAGGTAGHAGSDSDSTLVELTLPGDLAPYIGTGTFNMSLSATNFLNLSGQLLGVSISDFDVSGTGTATITYFYEAVPEPAMCVMLLTGAIAFVPAYRRFRRS